MPKIGCQNMYSTLKRVILCPPKKGMSQANFREWHYDGPLNQQKLNDNFKEFEDIICSHGCEVIMLDSEENLFDSVFPHDASLVTDRGAIILNMGKKLRKEETKYHKKLYEENNIPIIGLIHSPGTIEGGDCLWIDEKTLVIGRGFRSNDSGISQLQEILKNDKIDVIGYDLPYYLGPSACLHLMSVISILDEKLALVYEKLLPTGFWSLLRDRGFECISASENDFIDSNGLCLNVLALSPSKLIMVDGFDDTRKRLEDAGCTVETFDGSELCIKAEGGPTCLTRPIYRS